MCTISHNKFKAITSKKNNFFWIFIGFLTCAWNLEHFEYKDEYHSLIIPEIIDCKRGGFLNVWKVLLQETMR